MLPAVFHQRLRQRQHSYGSIQRGGVSLTAAVVVVAVIWKTRQKDMTQASAIIAYFFSFDCRHLHRRQRCVLCSSYQCMFVSEVSSPAYSGLVLVDRSRIGRNRRYGGLGYRDNIRTGSFLCDCVRVSFVACYSFTGT